MTDPARILTAVRAHAPLVHCITNFVTVNDCANIILAAGGSPTMSRHPAEVEEITTGCSSLVLNMGTINDLESMLLAGKRARELGHPIVLDPVGAGASALRRSAVQELITSLHPTVIRGNASEIRYLYDHSGSQAGGVDASLQDRITEDTLSHWAALALELSTRLDCVISISGMIDIAAGAGSVYAFHGGCAEMSRITGSGCMLTALMGACLGAVPEDPLGAAVGAQCIMNAAGEAAILKTRASAGGTMTFRMHLIDAVSLMKEEQLSDYQGFNAIPLCHL